MKTGRNKLGLPAVPGWTNSELITMIITGFIIGITVSLLFFSKAPTLITDHEVVIENFLGHRELMVVRIKD
jgi:hypothetical protein